MRFVVGVDLGQANDPTALAVVDQHREARVYAVRYLETLPLGTRYPEIVQHVQHLLSRPPLRGMTHLAFDETGVGRPVGDLFRQARMGVRITGITIHGGDAVTSDATLSSFRVPKRDIVSAVQLLLQQQRLKIAAGLRDAESLLTELKNFRVHVSLETGHDSYGAWRSGDHDDLVLALGIALWTGQRFWPLPSTPPEPHAGPSRKVVEMFEQLNCGTTNPDLFALGGYGRVVEDIVRASRGGWRLKTTGSGADGDEGGR